MIYYYVVENISKHESDLGVVIAYGVEIIRFETLSELIYNG